MLKISLTFLNGFRKLKNKIQTNPDMHTLYLEGI